jgi:hypothetical protein
MAAGRYTTNPLTRSGRAFATSRTSSNIRNGILNGLIPFSTRTLSEGQRLDTVAGQVYGMGSLWWIIAAASGIGWALQVPPGTLLTIPDNPGSVMRFT